MKKLLALLLAMLLTASAVVSCSENAAEPENSAPAESTAPEAAVDADVVVTEEEGAEIARENVPDTLPADLDLGGRTYTIHARGDSTSEIYSEEMVGEAVNDAIFERNNAVSERLNCQIECFAAEDWSKYAATLSKLRSSIGAGDGAYDIIAGWSASIPNLSLEGLLLNLNNIEYLDLSQNWWNQSAVSELQLGKNLHFVTGDIAQSLLHAMCVYVFNQQVAEDNQIENLYEVVKEHRWTIDYVYDLTSSIRIDLDGNGEADITDYWGMQASSCNDADGYMQGFRVSMMSRDENGYPVLDVDEEYLSRVVEKVYHLMWENPGCYAITGDGTNITDTIGRDRALLASTRIGAITGGLAEMESDYGVLPYPLLDENQSEYGTRVQDHLSLWCIPIDVQDPNGSGAVMEALAAQSWRIVTPAYFDQALKLRYSRDRETSEMMDLIKDSVFINFESLYNEAIGRPWYVLRDLMPQQTSDFASYWARNKRAVEKIMDKTLGKFIEDDN